MIKHPLKVWLILHALITFAAGITLFIAPHLIPQSIGIHLPVSAYLLCYFLASAEIALAYLSFAVRNTGNPSLLGPVIVCFMLFHAFTALGEIYYVVNEGGNMLLWMNVVARIVVILLFLSLSRRILSQKTK